MGFKSKVVTNSKNKMSMSCLDIKSSKIRSRSCELLCFVSHLSPLVRRSLWHRLPTKYCMNRSCRRGYSHVTRSPRRVGLPQHGDPASHVALFIRLSVANFHHGFTSPYGATFFSFICEKTFPSIESLSIPGILQVPTGLCFQVTFQKSLPTPQFYRPLSPQVP